MPHDKNEELEAFADAFVYDVLSDEPEYIAVSEAADEVGLPEALVSDAFNLIVKKLQAIRDEHYS